MFMRLPILMPENYINCSLIIKKAVVLRTYSNKSDNPNILADRDLGKANSGRKEYGKT